MTTLSQEKLKPVYFENLDALRFLAAFSVFVFHFFRDVQSFYPSLQYNTGFDKMMIAADKGALGVNFFFVLSGFLITYLILHERKNKESFSLGKFLIRRTLRIWPLYFIIVIIGFVIFPLIFDWYTTVHDPLWYVFFLANFDEIRNGLHDSVNFLTSPWSVAVEEQFYLFWGTTLYLLFRIQNFRLEYLILVLYILTFIFRWLVLDEPRTLYYHTFSVCQDILTGAFIGLSLFQGRSWLNRLQSVKKPVVLLVYLAGFGIVLAKNKIFGGELIVWERFVLSLFFGFVILDQIRGTHSFVKFGRFKAFNYLGKISYGLYMYHLIVLFLLAHYITSFGLSGYYLIPLYFFAGLGGTILISSLSYHLIEERFLRLKPV